eukprot:5245156-Pleurochrysis_carterae.AAC.2
MANVLHSLGRFQCGGRAVGRGQDVTLTVFSFVDTGLQVLFQDKTYCAESCSPICSPPGAVFAPLRTPLAVAAPAHRSTMTSLFSLQNLGAAAMEGDSSSDH